MLTPKSSPSLMPESSFMSPQPKQNIHDLKDTKLITQAGQRLYISTVPTATNYKEYKRKFGKGDRLNSFKQTLPNVAFFIDDDCKNVADVKENCPDIVAIQYNTNILTAQRISDICYNKPNNATLALDFDQTFTCTHTFQSTQKGIKQDPSILTEQHKDNYHQDIVDLINLWPGNILIITDHNNYEFIKALLQRILGLYPLLPPLLSLT